MPNTADLQQKVIKLVTDSQNSAVETLRNVTKTVENAVPVDKLPIGQVAPAVTKIIDSAFGLAQTLLIVNQNFVKQLLDAATPHAAAPAKPAPKTAKAKTAASA